MEFRMGGEVPMLCVGLAFVIIGCFLSWLCYFEVLPGLLSDFLSALQSKDYGYLALIVASASMISSHILIEFLGGAGFLFGRGGLVIDKASGWTRKRYHAFSMTVWEESHDFDEVSSVSFRRDIGKLLTFWLYRLRLHFPDGNSFVLLGTPWGLRKRGRLMARQIAAFLEVPGPEN